MTKNKSVSRETPRVEVSEEPDQEQIDLEAMHAEAQAVAEGAMRRDPPSVGAPEPVRAGGRQDPPPRPIDPSADMYALRGKDERVHYVWVNLEIQRNRAKYRSQGYRPVDSVPGGVQPLYDDIPQGQVIEVGGQTLMAISRERYEAMDAAGQAREDALMAQIMSPETVDSGVRPRRLAGGKKYLDVVNESREGM